MAGELFRLTTKTDMVHVPYKGRRPATIDLLAGHITIMFANPTATVPHVKAGKLRALGVMGPKRNEALPDVPTALESGYPDLREVIEWYGIVAPAATPRDVLARLNASVVRALSAPDTSKADTGARSDAESEHARTIRRADSVGVRALGQGGEGFGCEGGLTQIQVTCSLA
jgi:tripartite-type tricarboxylate transporter receptor subunit TctC